jgi:hypothetical protein
MCAAVLPLFQKRDKALLAFELLLQHGRMHRQLVGRYELSKRLPYHLLGLVAEYALGGRIDRREAQLQIKRCYDVVGLLGCGPLARIACKIGSQIE